MMMGVETGEGEESMHRMKLGECRDGLSWRVKKGEDKDD